MFQGLSALSIPTLRGRLFGPFKVVMGGYAQAGFIYGSHCKDGHEPDLLAESVQGGGDLEFSQDTHTHPSWSKTQMKSWLHMAQPHLGYSLNLSVFSSQAPNSPVSQRKLPTGDVVTISFGAFDWAEYPLQVRESCAQTLGAICHEAVCG